MSAEQVMEFKHKQIGDLRQRLMSHAGGLHGWIDRQIPRRFRSAVFPEDILQDVWVAAFRAFTNRQIHFDDWESTEVDQWLRTVAKHKLIDALRKHNREMLSKTNPIVKLSRGSGSYMNILDAVMGNGRSPSSIEAGKEATFAIQMALGCLPEDQRRALQMFYLAGRSRKSVADTLGVSETALGGTLFRAKKKLRDYLGDPARFFSGSGSDILKAGEKV